MYHSYLSICPVGTTGNLIFLIWFQHLRELKEDIDNDEIPEKILDLLSRKRKKNLTQMKTCLLWSQWREWTRLWILTNSNFFFHCFQWIFSWNFHLERTNNTVHDDLLCYVEFHPEHSLLFSDVLRNNMTLLHVFHPNLPLWNINILQSPWPFHHIPVSAPHSSYQSQTHYARAITEPSRNLSGSHGTALEVSWIHLGAFTISIIHQH